MGGKYSDNWAVDKILFDYVNGGSCSCISCLNIFNPEGLKGLINSISDLETDCKDSELRSANKSPWSPEMREEIWGDRVRLRFKMKKEMVNYIDFFDKEDVNLEKLGMFCRETLGADGLRKILQMPRSELMEVVKNKYMIHSAYSVVLETVSTQVAHFKKTKYPVDARCKEEENFEAILIYKKLCGFTLPISYNGMLVEEALQILLEMFRLLKGPKLLHRGPSTSGNGEEAENQDEKAEDGNSDCPSFRADRRVIRLLIARYWADRLIQKYMEYVAEN